MKGSTEGISPLGRRRRHYYILDLVVPTDTEGVGFLNLGMKEGGCCENA